MVFPVVISINLNLITIAYSIILALFIPYKFIGIIWKEYFPARIYLNTKVNNHRE